MPALELLARHKGLLKQALELEIRHIKGYDFDPDAIEQEAIDAIARDITSDGQYVNPTDSQEV
jgi:hypothetical protein